MKLRSMLTTRLEPTHPLFRYGMLAIIALLLAQDIRVRLILRPGWPDDGYTNLICILLVLFSYLSYQFTWPRFLAGLLAVLSWRGWMILAICYICYFYASRVFW
jgi:hypothetical protein